MNQTIAYESTFLGFSKRDILCFAFAIGVHSLLLLWKGGMLDLTQPGGGDLGEMLVDVNFMAEVPGGGGDMAPPTSSAPSAGILSKVKSFFKAKESTGEQEAAPAKAAVPKFSDDVFSKKNQFKTQAPAEDISISKGESKSLAVQKPNTDALSQAVSAPSLKQSSNRVALKDAPFQIVKPKNVDVLENVNAIPIAVGKTSGSNLKQLGDSGAGPALKPKAFNPGAVSGGFSGRSSSSGGGGGSGSSGGAGGLSMGDGGTNRIEGVGGTGSGSSMGTGGGFGTGGSGTGTGSGTGSGSGSGSGRGGAGKGFGSGTAMAALPRNKGFADEGMGKSSLKNSTNSEFQITGALANRPIVQKTKPPYENGIDGRVALRFRVDWSGKVLDGIVVVISSGSPTFDQKVIGALKQWIFSSLSQDRTNEIQEGVITFHFRGV